MSDNLKTKNIYLPQNLSQFTKAFITVLFLILTTQIAASAQNLSRRQILEAERLLAGAGYWITKVDGAVDSSTYHAVAAFQKVEGRKRTGKLTASELKALRRASRPAAAFSAGAAHVEVDLSRQVLFLVGADGTVTHILPVSTGNDRKYFSEGKWEIAHTPRGKFRITRQIKGTRKAPLGDLYHPNYFYGGVAIHGSNSIPFEPASHGCVRIPRFAAAAFSDLVSVGMEVYIF
jgi:lipoprotein-anchoring transpeptidase ErfK/SrfK